MYRLVVTIIAVIIGLWLLFAVFSALRGLVHLAMVLAILFVAYSLLSNLKRRHDIN